MKPFQKILVAVDFSAASDHALKHAETLARALDAELFVLNAYEFPSVNYAGVPYLPALGINEAVEAAAREGVDAIVRRLTETLPNVKGITREGSPKDVIDLVARAVGADLVVVGTHGRRGVSRALLGSVAERVVRTSHVPVLVVHSEAAETHGK